MKGRVSLKVSTAASFSIPSSLACACGRAFVKKQKSNKGRILLSVVLVMAIYCHVNAESEPFDSMYYLHDYDNWNSAPWSSSIPRYQLFFSQDMLDGFEGFIDNITFFGNPSDIPDPVTYDLNIYISSTNKTTSGLSTTNLEENHGLDKILVFSGNLELSFPTFVIDVDNLYHYTNSGNLLIDFYFNTVEPQENITESFGFQSYSYYGQENIARTYFDSLNGPDFIFNESAGALRTQIVFTPIPEPAALLLFALGSLALRRNR